MNITPIVAANFEKKKGTGAYYSDFTLLSRLISTVYLIIIGG